MPLKDTSGRRPRFRPGYAAVVPSATAAGNVTSYLLLALTAFLAATVLPFSSEVVLVPMLLGGHNAFGLWVAATAGNTMGAVVNWVLGRLVLRFRTRTWFPVSARRLDRAQNWFQRWGIWALLFTWLPVGGDALTFVAGLMRVKFWVFALLTGVGKGARYAVVVWLADYVAAGRG